MAQVSAIPSAVCEIPIDCFFSFLAPISIALALSPPPPWLSLPYLGQVPPDYRHRSYLVVPYRTRTNGARLDAPSNRRFWLVVIN